MSTSAPAVAALIGPPQATAVTTLRNATSDAHRRLESRLGLLSSDLTAALPNAAIAELRFEARRRVPALTSDLAILRAPFPEPIPFRLTSLPGALGALYVCEGSTLGGRVIAAHVLDVAGIDVPVAFFTSHADDVPRMWSTCRRVIDELLVTPPAVAEAAAVAVSVFDLFGEVLT